MKKFFLPALLLLSFVWFSFSASLEKDIKLEIKEKRVRDFSTEGLTLVFFVNIQNSSSKTYFLSSYNYRFLVNQQDYIRLQTSLDEGLRIDAKDETLVAFPVKITYQNLFRIIPEMKNEQHATCNLVGWARFSDGRRERGKRVLAFTGDFPIFWKPDIYLLPLQVKALTIGGADLRFEVKFANKNRYELFMNRISYHLEIAGHLVDQRTISGDKNIEKHGEKVFSIPVLLNFFEVGKGISNKLKQASVRCRFWGDVDIQTIWGNLTVPFDISDLLSIKRAP